MTQLCEGGEEEEEEAAEAEADGIQHKDVSKKHHRIQGGAPKIGKLVYNSNNYGLWYL